MSFRYNGKGVREITFDSLAKPLMAVQERHDKLEDNMTLLNSQAAQYDYIIQQEKERDPNSEIAKKYEGYLNEIKSVADTLAIQGVLGNTNVRSRVNNLAALYSKEITPISAAHEKRERQIALENELRMKNPNLLLSRTASDHGLKDFMDNTYRTDTLDLTTVMAEGANIGNLLSSMSKGEKIDKSLPGYIKIVETLGFDPADALLKGNTTLEGLVDMYYKNQSSTYNPDIMNANADVIKNAFTKGIYSTLRETKKSQLTGDKQWDFNKTLELDAIKRQRDFEDQVRIANLNKPDADDLGPGIMAVTGKISQGTEAEVKGRINDAKNFNSFSTKPNTNFVVTAPAYKKFFKDKIKPKADQLEKELTTIIRSGKANTKAYQDKLKEYQDYYKQLRALDKGTFTATGKELADFYQQTYKAKNYQQVQNILNKKAFLGTHTNMGGYELTSEFAKAVVPELVRKSEGKLEVTKLNEKGQKDGIVVITDADLKDKSLNIRTDGITGKVYLIIGDKKYILNSSVIPDRYDKKNNRKVNLIQELENSHNKLFNDIDLYIDPENDVNVADYDNHMRVIMKNFTALAAQSTQKPSSIK